MQLKGVLSMASERREGSAGATGDEQIGQSEERVKLGRILGQAAVAHLSIFEEILDDMKGVFNQGADL